MTKELDSQNKNIELKPIDSNNKIDWNYINLINAKDNYVHLLNILDNTEVIEINP